MSSSVRCLVLVKIYGNIPKKFFVKIIRNNDVRINEFPLFSFPFLRMVFISWYSLFISNLAIILFREGINQILVGISVSPTVVLVQFNGRLLFSVVGSKIENKFLSLSVCCIYVNGFLYFSFLVWRLDEVVQRNCPKHVEFISKNKFEKLVHIVGFIMRNILFTFIYFVQ